MTAFLNEWVTRDKEHCFAIVDKQSSVAPLQAFSASNGKEASPLLSGLGFSGDVEEGPWLLSVSPSFLAWWVTGNHATCGIMVTASCSAATVKTHFASLFQANLAGESVLFPFYRPEYIGPMLAKFDEMTLNIFLGPAQAMIVKNPEWIRVTSTSSHKMDIIERHSPWWKIEGAHLSSESSVPVVAHNIELWLWQHYPKTLVSMMTDDHNINQSLHQALLQHPDHLITYRALYTAITVIFGNAIWRHNDVQNIVSEYEDDDVILALTQSLPLIEERVKWVI
ncbi:DUF4123 domain-containing protein [Photobacterium indicum]|uniref:DUF4123 domain-containing protein n=1 Tax=Photobacterium indicum TaxID=81447 RepID=UPI003D0A2534